MRGIVLAVIAAVIGTQSQASVTMGSGDAAQYGVAITKTQHYDPWMGLTTDDSLKPFNGSDENLVAATLNLMEHSNNACEQLSALYMRDQRTAVVFKPLEDSGNGQTPEAGYDGSRNQIWINSNKPYLKNPENLRKKIWHESFHRAQDIMGIYSVSNPHDYSQRDKIVAYLQAKYPSVGQCKLPDVPLAIRGKVADTVSVETPNSFPADSLSLPSVGSLSSFQQLQGNAQGLETKASPAERGSERIVAGKAGPLRIVKTQWENTNIYYGKDAPLGDPTVILSPLSHAPQVGGSSLKQAVNSIYWPSLMAKSLMSGMPLHKPEQEFCNFPYVGEPLSLQSDESRFTENPKIKITAIDVDYYNGTVAILTDNNGQSTTCDLRTGKVLK